jgi:pimeloyl-ACP methyl ester carboxylesterase
MEPPDSQPINLHVTERGTGPRIVFVHGSMTTSGQAWAKQEELARRWTLVLLDRRGFEPNPPADESNFERDGADIARLLSGGVHLVGHSYGAIGSIFAAARRPDQVRSLTLIEAPTTSLIRGHPAVEAQIAAHQERRRTLTDPREFQLSFARQIGAPTDGLPDPLPAPLERQVRLLMNERPPWEATLPIDALRAAGIPVLVISGGWDESLEAASDALAAAVGPAVQRSVIPGRGHVVQRVGQPFNDRLEAFLGGVGVGP